jgi:hypothetical protein
MQSQKECSRVRGRRCQNSERKIKVGNRVGKKNQTRINGKGEGQEW